MLVHPIDSKLTAMGKDERAISVSGYVHRESVKYTGQAFEKMVSTSDVQGIICLTKSRAFALVTEAATARTTFSTHSAAASRWRSGIAKASDLPPWRMTGSAVQPARKLPHLGSAPPLLHTEGRWENHQRPFHGQVIALLSRSRWRRMPKSHHPEHRGSNPLRSTRKSI
jgi:hypothetical protein